MKYRDLEKVSSLKQTTPYRVTFLSNFSATAAFSFSSVATLNWTTKQIKRRIQTYEISQSPAPRVAVLLFFFLPYLLNDILLSRCVRHVGGLLGSSAEIRLLSMPLSWCGGTCPIRRCEATDGCWRSLPVVLIVSPCFSTSFAGNPR